MPDLTRQAVLVSAARTPIGKFLGALSPLSAADLGGLAIKALSEAACDDLIRELIEVRRMLHGLLKKLRSTSPAPR